MKLTVHLIVAFSLVLGIASPAVAQPDPATVLDEAGAALAAGDYQRALDLAATVTDREIAKADLAEAHRLLGLAAFFLGDTVRAEAEFLDYLRLDLDARLDPAVVPPEAVTFFEDVRARHAVELRKLRPRQRRYVALNLIPPGGQFQNKEVAKGWTIAGLELALVATNVTSYLMLRSWCHREDFTCESGGSDVPDKARRMRTINYVSGIALLGVYAYGVIDGFLGYRSRRREQAPVVTFAPLEEGGVVVGASLSF